MSAGFGGARTTVRSDIKDLFAERSVVARVRTGQGHGSAAQKVTLVAVERRGPPPWCRAMTCAALLTIGTIDLQRIMM
jgi:hypothetical protein